MAVPKRLRVRPVSGRWAGRRCGRAGRGSPAPMLLHGRGRSEGLAHAHGQVTVVASCHPVPGRGYPVRVVGGSHRGREAGQRRRGERRQLLQPQAGRATGPPSGPLRRRRRLIATPAGVQTVWPRQGESARHARPHPMSPTPAMRYRVLDDRVLCLQGGRVSSTVRGLHGHRPIPRPRQLHFRAFRSIGARNGREALSCIPRRHRSDGGTTLSTG